MPDIKSIELKIGHFYKFRRKYPRIFYYFRVTGISLEAGKYNVNGFIVQEGRIGTPHIEDAILPTKLLSKGKITNITEELFKKTLIKETLKQ